MKQVKIMMAAMLYFLLKSKGITGATIRIERMRDFTGKGCMACM
jgi:hypothetical protein